MSFSPRLSAIITGTATVAALVQLQPALAEKTAAEIREIAEEITVRIDGPGAGGSGFIVKQEGNTYTVLTNWHVVDRVGNYIVKTSDGRQHQVAYRQIREQPGVDLAVMYFTSSQPYRVAELGDSSVVTSPQTVYVSGWLNPLRSIPEPSYSFINGNITSVLSQPNDRGYSLIYNTSGNYKGMSGGPVLDEEGRVVGINGLAASSLEGIVGLYLAIPINTFEMFERLQAEASDGSSSARGSGVFYCGTYDQTPVTIARHPSRGEVLFIAYVSEYGGKSVWQRCEEVSARFQLYQQSGVLNYLVTAVNNGQPVICASSRVIDGPCEGLLFPLPPQSSPQEIIRCIDEINQGRRLDVCKL